MKTDCFSTISCAVCLTALFLFNGCTTLKTARKVENNIFYSSYPVLKIRIRPEFTYLGNMTPFLNGTSMDGSRELRNYFDGYVFMQHEDHAVNKTILILFETIETGFTDDFWKDVNGKLESGKIELNDEMYTYYTRMIYPSADTRIAKFMLDHGGYVMPACALSKVVGRIDSLRENVLFQIIYIEAAGDADLPCDAWGADRPLTDEQKKSLKRFHERFNSCFQFLDAEEELPRKEPFEILWDTVIALDTKCYFDKGRPFE